jgi:excisionase family DNA binding protein
MESGRLLYRVTEAAEALGISRSKAYELIKAGKIPSITVGGCVRVPVEELRTRLAQQVEASRTEHATS